MSLFPAYGKNAVVDDESRGTVSDIPEAPTDPEGHCTEDSCKEATSTSKLFPAYSSLKSGGPSKADVEAWQSNQSYTGISQLEDLSSSEDSDSSSTDLQGKTLCETSPTQQRGSRNLPLESFPPIVLNFDGSEQFYVDKKSERGYLRVPTLHRPACPQYFCSRGLGPIAKKQKKKKDSFKRYFSKKFQSRLSDSRSKDLSTDPPLDEEAFLEGNKLLNKSTMENVKNIQAWIDLVQFQDRTPMKTVSKLQLTERKLDILDKALSHNPFSSALYTEYVDIADRVLPSFEVSKIIEKLLNKDPTNYVLWRGLIRASQGSMARCNVPDVLKLYERAMQQMYRRRRCDDTMLKLFQSCAYFLKQSGLHEQLFALIKLALELNVSPDRFASIKPSEEDQNLLIEFEEVVLSSGLPMNEIWLRIEKLRTNFYFLPCPSGFTCSDPQRMVFNEDVCHFIYPLNQRENSLKLVFIILRLLRIPLPVYQLTTTGDHEESEWDAIENILPVFYYRSFCNDSEFDAILWDLIKELNMGPSYFLSHIGHEVYTNTVLEFLSRLSMCFTGVERMTLNLIWLRFERLLVIMARKEGKLTDEAKKRTRGKFKKFLKAEENRNEINYYVEYAALEADMENKELAKSVLESSYNQEIEAALSNKDKYHICAALVELHLTENRLEDAIRVLVGLGMGVSLAVEDVFTDAKKLVALGAIKKNLENLTGIESNVEVMEEEQLYLPDYLVNSIKCAVLAEALIKCKLQAIRTVAELMKSFANSSNRRHVFIREHLFELDIAVKGLNIPKDPTTLSWRDFEAALAEYPRNLYLIRKLVNFKGLLWYKLKSLALKSQSSSIVIFLIASVRLWYSEAVQNEAGEIQLAHKYRVRSLLHDVVMKDEKLKKNAILWRLYLRILFELENSFDQCKNALYSALDECPWNKSLYLDGAVFVPQELTQIQDLIIEKQLRIYALPEELEILRKDTTS